MFTDILDIPIDRQLWYLALFGWVIVWKGLALWKAAQQDSKPWFIVLLMVNTLGILEILYIYVFSHGAPAEQPPKKIE
jgi:hypothetical protein